MAEAYPSRISTKFPDVLLTVPLNRIRCYYIRDIQLGGEKPAGVKSLVSTLKQRKPRLTKASTSTS